MTTTTPSEPTLGRPQQLHWAWVVAAVAFVTLVGAAAFRSVPGVLIEPLHDEFGWSHGLIGSAVSLNLMLFGLISPFAAVLEMAPAKVLHGAVREQGLASSPTPETQVRVA